MSKTKQKKAKPIPATKLTLDECERRGWLAQVVEQRIPHTFITRDLFGVIDIIAVSPQDGIIGIQASSGTNLHGRRAKILAEPRMVDWLGGGGGLQLWTWSKAGLDTKLKPAFALRVEHYGLSHEHGTVMVGGVGT
jgi:hypothetical protein